MVTPARARLSALVRTIVDELPRRALSLEVAGHKLTLRGQATGRRASASATHPEAELERGPRALPDGRFHGDRPARTFAVR